MESPLGILVVFLLLPVALALEVRPATITVDGTSTIARNDDNFICATIDWWPSDKCNYNQCPWGNSSAMNLDLSHPLLAKAIQAFKPLRIRIGGSLQDRVLYDVGNLKLPCHPFRRMKDELFGFSKGCLRLSRWDQLYNLFNTTGAVVTFGLNALHGRHQIKKGLWGGAWDSSNSQEFIKYTISKKQHIDSWEFGNELCGSGVGAKVDAKLYGKDVINFRNMVDKLYENSASKPAVLAPGGFFDKDWFSQFLKASGPGVVNVVTHHIYNLGAGVDPNLVKKILDPHHLSKVLETFSSLKQVIDQNGPWSSVWVGESGGAYNSGGRNVSNTFVNSFWYLDQLGLSSRYHTKVYCRQTLIGGNYGLLDKTTYIPNPDYYSALLWHRLMGKGVLHVGSSASSFLRTYAHCSKGRDGITLLVINLSNQTSYTIDVQNRKDMYVHERERRTEENYMVQRLKKSVKWVGSKASDEALTRKEYHLTPEDGDIQSRTMLLNGLPIKLTEDGNIPPLEPVLVDVRTPVYVSPLSMAFVVFPNFDAPACV